MTDNPNYTKPAPTLPVVAAARDAFIVAINEAALGGPEQTVIKRAKRAELVSLMRQLAIYVSADCIGDMAKLLSSGFPVQKPTRVPIGPLYPPGAPVLVHGAHHGEIYAASSPINGAYSYCWQVVLASSPNEIVQSIVTSSARTTFSGLTAGKVYTVQVKAVGAAGESDWSNGSDLMAL